MPSKLEGHIYFLDVTKVKEMRKLKMRRELSKCLTEESKVNWEVVQKSIALEKLIIFIKMYKLKIAMDVFSAEVNQN